MTISRWILIGAVLALATSLGVSACGGGRATAPITPPPPLGTAPNLVDRGRINQAKAGSPERMVLIWARAVQFQDPRTMLRTLSPRAIAQGGRDTLTQAVMRIGLSLGRPEFVEVTSQGPRRSRVQLYLVTFDATRRPVYRQPITLYLVKPAGTWQIDDAAPLLEIYRAILEAERRSNPGLATPTPTPTPTATVRPRSTATPRPRPTATARPTTTPLPTATATASP